MFLWSSSACTTSGFTRGDDGNYYKLSTSGDLKNWNEARKICEDQNAQLAIIYSDATHDYVNRLSKSLNARSRFWIGVHDSGIEGKFINVDGTPVQKTYWSPGQPDNQGQYRNEDCVEYYRYDHDNKWNDLRCTYPSRYICQRHPKHQRCRGE